MRVVCCDAGVVWECGNGSGVAVAAAAVQGGVVRGAVVAAAMGLRTGDVVPAAAVVPHAALVSYVVVVVLVVVERWRR